MILSGRFCLIQTDTHSQQTTNVETIMSTQAISATSGRTPVSTSGTSSSAGSTSSLTLSQRRALLSSSSSRPSSSLGGSSSLANTKTQRPPVLLHFTETTLRCGFAGDALPKDIIPLCLFAAATSSTSPHDSATTTTTTTFQNRGEPCPLRDSAAVWYRYLAPLLQYAYQRLGLLVASTTTTRGDRKVVVLYREWDETTMPRVVEHALLAVLIHTLQVPAVSLQGAAWSMIPSSFPMLSHLLVVHVGLDQASVVVHAAGETLRFTYQSVSLAETRAEFAATPQASSSSSSLDHALYLDETHPNSLLVAMLKTLEACPRMDRKSVVQNLVFAGTGLLTQPHIPLLVTRQLQTVLAQAAAAAKAKSTRRTPRTTTTTTTTETTEEEEDPAADTEETTQQPLSVSSSTMIPLAVSSWAGDLHAHVGLVTCPVQPDHVVWLGASGWAASWFAKDPTLMTNAVEWRTEWPPLSTTAAAALSQ